MFTPKDDDITAVVDRPQRIGKPPTLFRYNGDSSKTDSKEMYALVHGEPTILTKCTETFKTYCIQELRGVQETLQFKVRL